MKLLTRTGAIDNDGNDQDDKNDDPSTRKSNRPNGQIQQLDKLRVQGMSQSNGHRG